MKLSIPKFQVGKERSEKYVLRLCKDLKLPIRNKKDLTKILNINSSDKPTQIKLLDEVDFVRKNGKANILQHMFDANDRFLNTPVSMAILGPDCGLKIQMSSNYGNHATNISFPGSIEAPEVSFSDDISYYRRDAVNSFNSDDIHGFTRAYRAYLQCCVSLIDCFIHRYTFHVKELIPSTDEYENTAVLDSRKSIEERLEAWITTFATHRLDAYKNSKQRSKFLELKRQRNEIVHPVYPSIGYSVKNAVKYLNFVQDGVGGLMSELRKYTGYSENIGFIRQVKTQAEIKFVKA